MGKPPQEIPEPNRELHLECRIMKNVLVSAMESVMGVQFTNYQTGEYLQKILTDIVHPQTTNPVETNSLVARGLINSKIKQILSWAIDMYYFWIKDRTKQGHFHIFCDPEKYNLRDYFTKYHPAFHNGVTNPLYITSYNMYIYIRK